MKKILLPVVFIFLVAILFFSLFQQFIFLSVFSIFFILWGILFYVGSKRYKQYISSHTISLTKNLQRNYDFLILGSKNITFSENHSNLDLRNYGRNQYTDFLIVQRYYSFLKKGGTVRILIDLADKTYQSSSKISYFDYPLLHKVTLLEHGISINSKFEYLKRLWYYPLFFLISIPKKQFQNHVLECSDSFAPIKEFCSSRGIQLELYD